MRCADAEQLFDAYLDGQLAGALRLELDAHRLRCRRCQQSLAMMEAVGHVIANDPDVPNLSQDFTARVMGAIAVEPQTIRLQQRRKLIFSASLLANAAVVALLAFSYFGRSTTPEPFRAANEADWGVVFTPYHKLVAVAQDGVVSDVGRVVDYTRDLAVPQEFAASAAFSPLTDLLHLLVPPAHEEREPAGSTDVYSL